MTAFHYSPLTAVAVDPNGPSTTLTVKPYHAPTEAVVVTANAVVADINSQWIQLGLTVPDTSKLAGLVVCYQVIAAAPGTTFISQTRLTEMTMSNSAAAFLDDTTNRTSAVPASYTCNIGGYAIKGTITLKLKLVFGNKADKILIGRITLQM